MTDMNKIKIGGYEISYQVENIVGDAEHHVDTPMDMSVIRESWNRRGMKVPTHAMNITVQLKVGDKLHKEKITMLVGIQVNMIYNSAATFKIIEQMLEWAKKERNAEILYSLEVIFCNKHGERITEDTAI